MADDNAMKQKLLGAEAEVKDVAKKGFMVMCGGYTAACVVILFVLTWLLQGFLYFIATTASGCRAGALENYNYLNNQAAKSDTHDEAYNIMPQNTYLSEQTRTFYGQSFSIQPIVSNAGGGDASGALASASVGNWWLSWGPVFNTYVYQDIVDSQPLLWMRRSMLRLGQSHRVGRCDGKGPLIEFEEGTNWFSNKVHSTFGMTQSVSLKVFVDNNDGKGRQWLATLEEQNQGTPGITVVSRTNGITNVVADAVLHNHHEAERGAHAQWYVQNKMDNSMPYYLLSAATLLYAFHFKGAVEAGQFRPEIMEMAQSYLRNSTAVFESPPKKQLHV